MRASYITSEVYKRNTSSSAPAQLACRSSWRHRKINVARVTRSVLLGRGCGYDRDAYRLMLHPAMVSGSVRTKLRLIDRRIRPWTSYRPAGLDHMHTKGPSQGHEGVSEVATIKYDAI